MIIVFIRIIKLMKLKFIISIIHIIVEYDYELKFDGFLGCYWPLLNDYDLASKMVELTVKSSKEIDFSFRTNKFFGSYDTITLGKIKIRTWKATYVNSISKEEFLKV